LVIAHSGDISTLAGALIAVAPYSEQAVMPASITSPPASSPPVRPVAEQTIDRLKQCVGKAGYLEASADTEPYCRSWRDGWTGRVPLVVRPVSTAELADVMRICAETGTRVVPQGGNTGLTGAGQPHDDMSEIIISTARLNTVRAIDTLADTITVEAGVVLAEIQRLAAAHDRLFPLSLGAEGSAQIGGNIATNAGGTQVIRYGNTRNLVLGLEVVLPDGRVWDGLRSLRKDNTGYDLRDLFIGAEGTLGIVTAAVLRLFPRPTAVETAWLGLPDPLAAVRLLSLMRSRLGEQISAFELIGQQAVRDLVAHVAGHADPLSMPAPWSVLIEISAQGAPGSLADAFTDALAAAIDAGHVTDAVIASSAAQSKRFWQMREDVTEAQRLAGGGISHDISVPLQKIPEFIDRANAALEQLYPEFRRVCFGHVGDGNMHYNPGAPAGWTSARWKAERETVNRIVHDIVVSLSGSISAEHGIGQLRLTENEHYKSAVELDLMRTIKRAIDPGNLMNPGKVLRM
jgi:FAD/FMN-containing dehydrogenase